MVQSKVICIIRGWTKHYEQPYTRFYVGRKNMQNMHKFALLSTSVIVHYDGQGRDSKPGTKNYVGNQNVNYGMSKTIF